MPFHQRAHCVAGSAAGVGFDAEFRSEEAHFFSRDLRLQGVVETGTQSGGVDMHPQNPLGTPIVRIWR